MIIRLDTEPLWGFADEIGDGFRIAPLWLIFFIARFGLTDGRKLLAVFFAFGRLSLHLFDLVVQGDRASVPSVLGWGFPVKIGNQVVHGRNFGL